MAVSDQIAEERVERAAEVLMHLVYPSRSWESQSVVGKESWRETVRVVVDVALGENE